MTITFQEKAAVQAAVEFFRVASTSSQPVECGVGKNGKWELTVFDEVRQDEINSRHDAYGDTEPTQIDFTEFTQDEYEALLRVLHKIEYARLVPAKEEQSDG